MRIEHELVIERPADDVFSYLTDIDNLAEWQADCVEARREDEGPLAVGSRWRQVQKFLGRRIESTLEATALEPGRRFDLRVVSGPVPFEVSHTLEPADGGTRLLVVGEGEPGGAFKLAEPLLARAVRRQFEGDFGRLKTILEGRT